MNKPTITWDWLSLCKGLFTSLEWWILVTTGLSPRRHFNDNFDNFVFSQSLREAGFRYIQARLCD